MKVLLITGGASGIGAATARIGATQGYAVAVNYRTKRERAEALVREIGAAGGRAVAVPGDMAREDDIVAMFDATERALGPVTHLVNSAGISGGTRRVEETDADVLDRLFRVNVIGLMLCCREAAKRMSTKRGGKGGAVVNVSSMAATIAGRPGKSHYAASKAAVDTFTVGFARDVAAEGIRVNAVRPGVTVSDMTADALADPAVRGALAATIPMQRVAEAEEVAHPILWLLSDEGSFVTATIINAGGGGFLVGSATL